MKIVAALILLAGCSGEQRPDAAPQEPPGQSIAAAPLALGSQSPEALAKSKQRTDAAAAQIMAGGFLPDGSFVHGDHIHKPGQEKCPSDQSGGPVQ